MELALSNNQGELSPLEIGLHALKAVPESKGGRGQKGGLADYARRLGQQQASVSRYRQAAEVFLASKPMTQNIGFMDKAQHLAAIHSLPRGCWPAAVEAIGESSAAEVRERVKQALASYNLWKDRR